MKKLILFLLIIPALAWAGDPILLSRSNPYVLGARAAPVASCTTSSDSALFDKEGASADNSLWACIKWTLASNVTITEYVADIDYDGGTGNVEICLLPHNSGADLPDGTTCITGTSKQLPEGSFSGSKETKAWTLSTPKDIDSGTYWVCNISGVTRNYYYSSGSERSCYGTSSCSSGGTSSINVEVWGCSR
jgi:hypothetical protein